MSTVVLCQYFVQNEEIKTKRQILNAFVLPMKFNSIKEVRVADVKKHFPFNPSEYHFRFQTKMGAMKVWIDTSKDSVAVPHLDGAIRIKLLKLPSGVRVKEQKAVPQSAPKQASPVKEKTVSSTLNYYSRTICLRLSRVTSRIRTARATSPTT